MTLSTAKKLNPIFFHFWHHKTNWFSIVSSFFLYDTISPARSRSENNDKVWLNNGTNWSSIGLHTLLNIVSFMFFENFDFNIYEIKKGRLTKLLRKWTLSKREYICTVNLLSYCSKKLQKFTQVTRDPMFSFVYTKKRCFSNGKMHVEKWLSRF